MGSATESTGAWCVFPRAFAHRDSAHPVPLGDALAAGFTALEIDVWLRGGDLLVGHDESELDPAATLRARYVEPIEARVRCGTLLPPAAGGLTLVLDVKTRATRTYRALDGLLREHAGILTSWRDGVRTPGPVTVLVSGHRARRRMAHQRVRYAAYDGRRPDVRRFPRRPPPAELVPMVSADWSDVVRWTGAGELRPRDLRRLARLVSAGHGQARAVRFWGTPDRPGPERAAVWSLLCDLDVDAINTDDLHGLADFLRARGDRECHATPRPCAPGP